MVLKHLGLLKLIVLKCDTAILEGRQPRFSWGRGGGGGLKRPNMLALACRS